MVIQRTGSIIQKSNGNMNGKLQPFQRGQLNATIDDLRKQFPELSEDILQREYKRVMEDLIFVNDEYQVNIHETNSWVHLSIKRLDKEPVHDWRDLQAIKNMLLGNEIEAVELYPAESRLVDTANQYHLWCLKDEDGYPIKFNFGFGDRSVESIPSKTSNVKQRPL